MEKTLECAMEGKSRNLQMIKWIAACFVIVSHAFPITTGNTNTEPLLILTRGRVSFGGLAVGIFFFTAGLYIAQSMEKKKTAKAFFAARCKRIFPPLIFTVLLTIFMGMFLTTYSLMDYVTNPKTWMYLLNGILIPVHNLPGIFENQPYLPTVNGALWTLPVEFACYVVCFLLYKCKLLTGKGGIIPLIVIYGGVVIVLLFEDRLAGLSNIIRPCLLFGIGMMTWVYRGNLSLGGKKTWIVTILFFAGMLTPFANIAMYVFLPFMIVELSYLEMQVPEKLAKPGALSYGIYLCGFPIQQILVHFFHQMTPLQNILIAIPLALCGGAVIYFVTERKKK